MHYEETTKAQLLKELKRLRKQVVELKESEDRHRRDEEKLQSVLAWQEAIIEGYSAPLLSKSGKIIGGLAIIHDSTERKQLEKQLLQSQKMEAIGRFAGGVAHDFNNLLTVILGTAESGMQDSKPGNAVQQDFITIEKVATEASELVRRLLTFSKNQILKPQLLNLNSIIMDHMKMLKSIIGENILLKTNLDKELSSIWADSVQLQQVLMNISINARDAMPRGGNLYIETRNFLADNNFPIKDIQQTDHHAFKTDSNRFVEIIISD